jgi:hypothetical protein
MQARCWNLASLTSAIVIIQYVTPASGQTSSPTIEVYVVGTPESISRLEAALGAVDRPIRWIELEKLDLTQVTQRPQEAGIAVARAWVDCSSPDRARLYFANWNTERFLVREVPFSGGLTPLTLEMLAQIVESSLSALLTDDKAGLTRAEMTAALEPAAPAKPETPRSSPLAVTLGAFYGLQAFAPDWPVEHGLGLSAAFGERDGPARLSAWLTVQYQVPEMIQTSLIGVRLDTVAMRAGVELGKPISEDVVLSARVGGGGDLLHVAPRQGTNANASLKADQFYWDYMTQIAVAVTVAWGDHLVTSAALVTDVDLAERHYDLSLAGATTRVAAPWRLRPGFMAGVAWH